MKRRDGSEVWAGASNRVQLRHGVLFLGALFAVLIFISGWLPPLLLAGVIAAVLFLARPLLIGYLLIGTAALLSGTERGRLIPLFQPNEVCLLLSAYTVVLLTLFRGPCTIPFLRYFVKAFAALVGGGVLIPIGVYFLRGTDLNAHNAFKFFAPLQYFLSFWVFAALPEREEDQRALINCMLGCASIVALVGILQALGFGLVLRLLEDWYPSDHEAMAASAGRVTSLMGAWNSLGVFMMISLLVAWSVLPEIRKGGSRILLMGAMALCAICLLASGSYAGILGLLIGILLIEVISSKRRRRTVPILVLMFVMIAVVLSYGLILEPLVDKRFAYQLQDGGILPHTLLYRIVVWREIFIPAIIQHFPWPVSPTVPESYAWHFEESQYVLYLFRTGLTGLLGFFAWLGITINWLNHKRREAGSLTSVISTAALTMVVVVSILGITNEVFSFSGSADYLWMMLGLVASRGEAV